jgi:DNA-binding GntR family transcriptional regulator
LRLCNRLGVSRTPLREALKVLSAEGLVRLLPNKGAIVVRVTHKEVEEAIPLFGTLEALAGELACARIDKESLGRIKITHRQMVEHFRDSERRPYSELNRAFHNALFEAADNKPLSETNNMMKARLSSLLPGQPGRWSQQVREMFQTAFQNSTHRAHWAAGVEDHEQMLAALEAGDGVQFAQIARKHIRRRAEVMHMAIDMLEARANVQHEWMICDSQAATPSERTSAPSASMIWQHRVPSSGRNIDSDSKPTRTEHESDQR